MNVEEFSVSSIEVLRDSRFDEKVFGKPGKMVGYIVAVLFWIYIVSWVYKDAEHRYFEGSKAKYIWLVVTVFAAPVAWFVYLILRPSSDLDESYLQRVEERYLAFESRGLGYCAKCGAPVDPDYIFCNSCGVRLRSRCPKCKSLVEADAVYCASCGHKQKRKPKTTIVGLDEYEKSGPIRTAKPQLPEIKKSRKDKKKNEPFFVLLGKYFSKATSSFFTVFMPKKSSDSVKSADKLKSREKEDKAEKNKKRKDGAVLERKKPEAKQTSESKAGKSEKSEKSED